MRFSNESPFRSNGPDAGVPRAVYPATVDERGKRFDAKSKAEDTEKERSCGGGRGVVSWSFGASGSSAEKETLREELMPEAEEDTEFLEVPGVEEARDASSRESRGACEEGGFRLEYVWRDMARSGVR